MINGLGVVGWGVGGIDAEAAMLGQAHAQILLALTCACICNFLENSMLSDICLFLVLLFQFETICRRYQIKYDVYNCLTIATKTIA